MISLQHLSKRYKECLALDDCSLELDNTGLVAITGVSGSGKTTLLNILGLLDTPSSGEILFNGKTLNSDEEKTTFRSKNIGYVFQDAVMLEQLSVKENIILPTSVTGLGLDEDYFEILVKELGIDNLLDRRVNELSAGQKQRIALARALICKPKILLADEPTGNLDENTTIEVFKILKGISERILVVVVTHNETMAKRFASRIVNLKYGKIEDDILNESHDESVSFHEISSIEEKKQKQKFLFLSWANFKVKKRKMIKIVMVTVLTLLVSALGFAFVEVSNNNSRNVERFFLDTNMLKVTEDMQNNITAFLSSEYGSDKFLSDYSFLKDDERIEAIAENYDLTGLDISGDIKARFKDISTINIDEYFKQRLLSSKIVGDFLSTDSDIILSSATANMIFPNLSLDECLGKKVIVSGVYYSQEFNVVGINRNEDVNGKIVSYITVSAAKSINDTELKRNVSVELYSDRSYSIERTTEGNEIYIQNSGKALLLKEDDLSNYDLVCGKTKLRDGEMLVSTGVINDFGDLFGYSSLQADELTDNGLEELSDERILCVANNSAYFKVVGVYEDDKNDLSVIVNESDYANLIKVVPASISVYVTNSEDIADIITSVEGRGLIATAPYSYFKDAVGNRMSAITYIFLFLVLFMLFTTFLIINTFSKHSIWDSTRDIGLLKAIGADKRYILKVYAMESALTGLISSFIAVVIYPMAIGGFNFMFEKGYINIMTSPLSISASHLAIIMLGGVCIFVLSSLPSILRAAKIDAIVSIRKIG